MNNKQDMFEYSARNAYQDESAAETYITSRYSSLFGKYSYKREQNAVRSLINGLPSDLVIADCPCGTGRWWPALALRARHIIALDISEGMRRYAEKRAGELSVPIEVLEGGAEQLPLADESVDIVFSHALTKHLPIPVQARVLKEFARVARRGVICSFGIFSHLTYEIWRHRNLEESFPVLPEQLKWMGDAAGLKIVRKRRCTTPIGTEFTVYLEKH